MKSYDEILIGSGPAAYRLSNLLATTDHRVLVVEGFEYGGTCPNYGCEPKIFLEGAARAVLQSQQLLGRGIKTPATLDWSALMKTNLDRFNPWSDQTREIISKSHDVVDGYARFVNAHTIEVAGQHYHGKNIIIATGQTPNILDIPGKDLLHTSYDVLSMTELPKKMAFIGGGFVALELATLVAAAGADVTIIVHSDRLLREFPVNETIALGKAMAKRGIHFAYNTNLQAIQQTKQGLLLQTDKGTMTSDYVVDATGRHPNIDRLGLEKADIQHDRHGIAVDSHLMTSAKDVYAIGDVVNRKQPKLTPVAEFEGQYLFDLLTGQNPEPIHYPTVARATFTFPEIAQVGINPDDVQKKADYQIKTIPLNGASLYAGQNDQTTTLTLVFSHHQLVGASEIGDHAADDINNFLPVIGLKISGQQYRQALIAIYPALADKVASLLQ